MRIIYHHIEGWPQIQTAVYTVREAANLLGCSDSNIRRLIKKRRLERENAIHSKVLIEESSLLKYQDHTKGMRNAKPPVTSCQKSADQGLEDRNTTHY